MLKKGLSLERLVCLLEIEEAGGIAGAAEGDATRQSLMSRQVSGLEEALGATLLERTSKPHQLTEAGREVARCLRGFAGDLGHCLDTERQTVTIAAGESVILWLLIPRLAKLKGRVRFRNMRSRDAGEAVRSEQVDLAIHHAGHGCKEGERQVIGEFGLTLVSSEPIGKAVKKWTDLPPHDLVTLEGNGSTRQQVETLVASYPQGPQIAMECTSYPQVLAACSSGLVGVVPEIAQKQAKAMGLGVFPIQELKSARVNLEASWLPRKLERNTLLKEVASMLQN